MKLLISLFLTIAISTSSCSHTDKFTNLSGYPDFNGLNRYEDNQVVCYLFLKDDYPALWCYKKKQDQ